MPRTLTRLLGPGLASLSLLSLAWKALPAATIRVPEESATIHAAIEVAEAGDVIVVAPGRYTIADSIDFRGKPITVRSEAGPEATVILQTAISGRGNVAIFDDGEGPEAVLDGFTLTGGVGSGASSTRGGGILCVKSSPTLKNLIVTENRATYGGGIYCEESFPALIDCTLSRNHVFCGGGAYCDASSPVFRNCTIRGNRGSYASSGIHSKNGSAPVLENCRILSNLTYAGGGLDSYQSAPTLYNCIIAGNAADNGGGAYVDGASSLLLVNCTVVANYAKSGGNLFSQSSDAILVNCIVLEMSAPSTGFRSTSCLLGEDPLFVRPGRFDPRFFSEAMIRGESCLLPAFVLEEPDFRLRYGSSALDAGTSVDAPSRDIDGVERPQGGGVDIGAYEYAGAPSVDFRRGDVDGDGELHMGDAVSLLGFLFGGDLEGLSCLKSGDANDDARLDVSDAIHILGGLFLGQRAPAAPYPSCGRDPSPDPLSCDAYEPCVEGP